MIELTVTGNVSKATYSEPNGTPVLNFTVATNRRFMKAGNPLEVTEWTTAEMWGPRAAKLREYVTKGVKLLVRGRPQASAYVTKDGTPKSTLSVIVEDLEFLSPKPRQTTA